MDDLISRATAIDALREKVFHNLTDEFYGAMQVMDELPSVQPIRKKGRWKRRLVDSGFNADWYCSKCGWKTALEEHGYNYCPHCGADMRGEKANENNIQ